MTKISEILNSKKHSPYEMPDSNWVYYQEWNRVLFLHYEVPVDLLTELVPDKLTIDTFEGKAYISIVPFTMENIRPRYLPSVSFISNFHEINVRTYVEFENKKGVFFLNIEAEKFLSIIVAKALSGLPYEKSKIKRDISKYYSKNIGKGFCLDTGYLVTENLTRKSDLDIWLTERYCLYLNNRDFVYRYDIHHLEWEIKNVEILNLDINYTIGQIQINKSTDLVHYSDGVQVLAWNKVKI